MKHIKLFEYFSKFDLDFFVEKYNEWNNQNSEPGYSKPSYESVLEFLQNNYEDFSTDDNLIEGILQKLKEETITESTDNNVEFEVGDIILYDDKYIAKVIKLHPGHELLRIRIYYSNTLTSMVTDISSTLCQKFNED